MLLQSPQACFYSVFPKPSRRPSPPMASCHLCPSKSCSHSRHIISAMWRENSASPVMAIGPLHTLATNLFLVLKIVGSPETSSSVIHLHCPLSRDLQRKLPLTPQKNEKGHLFTSGSFQTCSLSELLGNFNSRERAASKK